LNSLGDVRFLLLCTRPVELRSAAAMALRQFNSLRRIRSRSSRRFSSTSSSSNSLVVRCRFETLFFESCISRDWLLTSENTLMLAEYTDSASSPRTDLDSGERAGVRAGVTGRARVDWLRALKGRAGVLASAFLVLVGVEGLAGVRAFLMFTTGTACPLGFPLPAAARDLCTLWSAFSSAPPCFWFFGDSSEGLGERTKYWQCDGSLTAGGVESAIS